MTDQRIRELPDNVSRGFRRWVFAIGGFSAALGLVVMLGWHTHTAVLIQLDPMLVPMQYNTAIGFLLSGLMLLAHGRDLRAAELTFAALLTVIGVLTLIEYIAGVDLRIDQLLMQHYITVETSHPGRMAPNTALCFSLTGIAIVLSSGMLRKFSSPINAAFGTLIMGLGVVAMLGYLLELEAAYGWGQFSRMAMHTALGFIVVGSGLLAIGWKSARALDKSLPPWLPVPAAIAVLTVTFTLWQATHPDRDVTAVQRSHDLVFVFFGIALAVALAFALRKVVSEIVSRQQLQLEIAGHRQTQQALRERIKELTGLYSLSNIFNDSNVSPQDALEMAVAIIPPAWQYPDITCARIAFHEQAYTTGNFTPTEWRQTSDIFAAGELVGEIEVGYLQEMPLLDEGPFLKEERELIDHLADVIGRNIHRGEMMARLSQAQKMEAVGQLTGGIAHDFNNLLAVIMGNLELLRDSVGESGLDSKVCLNDALRSARRGATLTSQLLSFSHKQMLDPKRSDLSRVIRDMHDLLQRTLGETIDIETVGAAGLWPCFIDRPQLENALLNLALNARDAMPGGGKMTIETANVHLDDAYVETQIELAEGQYVMLAVSDTGTGMSQETREHAFEPFYTTKGAGGTGLGLSMIHGFAKQSKGHVNIYSELGHGTTVKLYLPRYYGDAAAAAPQIVAGDIPGGNETILVVEDSPALLTLLIKQLGSLGYSVLPATDARVALEIFAANQDIELLLSDVVLPGGLSGRDLAEQIHQRRPEMKVLYMSGYTKNAIVHKGQLDRGAMLLKKPFTKADLARKLRLVLDHGMNSASN